VIELPQDQKGGLVTLESPACLDDPGRLEARAILAGLEIRGEKDSQENRGLDSKDCQVIQATEDVLACRV